MSLFCGGKTGPAAGGEPPRIPAQGNIVGQAASHPLSLSYGLSLCSPSLAPREMNSGWRFLAVALTVSERSPRLSSCWPLTWPPLLCEQGPGQVTFMCHLEARGLVSFLVGVRLNSVLYS